MIKVVVAITTYNLEKYIAQALDSVLNQITSFEYQIVVADDASTDKTCEILETYKQKYGDKIKVLYAEKNMGSLANSNRIFDNLQCEYFTFLDGDDYWQTNDRIQKQVEFLDAHPHYSMCAGNTRYLIGDKPGQMLLKSAQLNKTYQFADYVSDRMPFFHTSSIMVRNSIFVNGLPDCFKNRVGTYEECALRGEDFRRLIHLQTGPLYAMDELLSVYRIHNKGIWQGSSILRKALETTIGFHFYSTYFDETYSEVFNQKFQYSYLDLMTILEHDYGLTTKLSLPEKDAWLLAEIVKSCNNEMQVANEKWGKSILQKKFKHKFLNYFKRKKLRRITR